MEKISLQDQLETVEPSRMPRPGLLMNTNIKTFMSVLRHYSSDFQIEAYQLYRCTSPRRVVAAPLMDVLYTAAEEDREQGNRIAYDVLVRPFVAILRERGKIQ